MWLSSQGKKEPTEELFAQVGKVSIPGTSAGVYLAGERRNVAMIAPAGYHWLPQQQDAVLVIPCGEEKSPYMIGKEQEAVSGALTLSPGEVWISVNGTGGIHLRRDGTVNLIGEVYLNGVPLVMSEAAPPTGGGTV